jgi:hypothetical protein
LAAPSVPAYTFLQKQSFYSLYITESNCVDNSVAGALKYRNFWLIGLNLMDEETSLSSILTIMGIIFSLNVNNMPKRQHPFLIEQICTSELYI